VGGKAQSQMQSQSRGAGESFVRVTNARGAASSGQRARTDGAPAGADRSAFEAQLSRGLAAALRQGGGRVTMRLEPHSLGRLTVQLQMKGERVSARFEASSDQARQLLESARTELRAALEAKGLVVERVQIQMSEAPDQGGAGARDSPPGDGGGPAAERRGDGEDGGGPSDREGRGAEPRESEDGSSGLGSGAGEAGEAMTLDDEVTIRLGIDVVG